MPHPSALRWFATSVMVSAWTTGRYCRPISWSKPEAARPRWLPIACVEGWSASATWTGVRVRDLLDLMGVPADRDVVVHSLQPAGAYRTTVLPANFAADPDTLLALRLNGLPLSLDHGFPCRLIAPNRPGVLQTKWVSRLEVSP